jgi:hypothetical protein
MPADGSAPAERLSDNLGITNLNAWSPDGQILAFTTQRRGKLWDIGILPLEAGEPRWLLSAPHSECCVALSPDGRLMAYASNGSGRWDVFVRPFPDSGGRRHMVSTEGGMQPRWSRDGKELFDRGLGERPKLIAVEVDTRGGFRAGVSRPLFDDRFGGRVGYFEAYFDAAPDGRSFVFVEEPPEAPAPTRLVLIPDWASELEAKLEASTSRPR